MRAPSSVEIVKSGQAYTVADSGLTCARCYASHGLVCPLAYRYAPTWGFTGRPRPRWVETFTCGFCRNEINEPDLRLPIAALPTLIAAGNRFYDRASGDLFEGMLIPLVEFPPPPEPAPGPDPSPGSPTHPGPD